MNKENANDIKKIKVEAKNELLKHLEEKLPVVDSIIDEELKTKKISEIYAYCGEESNETYKNYRRLELLYPNDADTNLKVQKKVRDIGRKIKMCGKLYNLLEFIGNYDPYLKQAAIRRKNYSALKLYSRSCRQKSTTSSKREL